MNPLSASSLNTERARAEGARAHPSADPAGGADAAGGFAQLLQGARGSQPPAPGLQAQAQPGRAPAPARPADAGPAADAAEDPQAEATKASDAADEADKLARETGPTLAHWLLHGGAQAPDAAQAGMAVPPPQQPAGSTDDLKAAAMAREVLDAVRSRAKAVAGAKPGGAHAQQPDPLADKAAGRREAAGLHAAVAATAAPATEAAPERPHAAAPEGRFADAMNAALPGATATAPQGPVPDPVTSAAAAAPAEQAIATPVHDAGFDAAVGVSISRLARDGVHEARLQLNPAELGPVTVRIALQGQEARLELGAAHAETRALLDASLPALTEAFRADGLVLAASQVSDLQRDTGNAAGQAGHGSAGSQPGRGQGGGQQGSHSRDAGTSTARFETEIRVPTGGTRPPGRPGASRGGLDLYA